MLNKLKYELNLIGLALTFFSRIVLPFKLDYSSQKLSQASRYFALVGWLLGGIVVCVFYACLSFLNADISLWLAMGLSLLLTGCFHEDGLADMADGFGGGYSIESKLNIMKDSRLGTYGSSILIFVLLGKFLLLRELIQLNANSLWLIIPFSYALSRAIAASYIFDMTYQTQDETSKSKPLANHQTKTDLLILILSVAVPAILFFNWQLLMILSGVLYIFRTYFKSFLMRHLAGYTGDCLGAAQQLAELVIYLMMVILLSRWPEFTQQAGIYPYLRDSLMESIL